MRFLIEGFSVRARCSVYERATLVRVVLDARPRLVQCAVDTLLTLFGAGVRKCKQQLTVKPMVQNTPNKRVYVSQKRFTVL